jgi:probable phosphoglycerate mutase
MPPILLARHGQCQWNVERRRHGRRDSPLTPVGMEQARRMGYLIDDLLGRSERVLVLSSPLGRARGTAEILARQIGAEKVSVVLDPRLQEISFGPWEGLTDEDVRLLYPELWAARQQDKWNYALPPNGESYAQAFARAERWLEGLDPRTPMVVVTHFGFSRALRAAHQGLEPAEALRLDHPHHRLYWLGDGGTSVLDAPPIEMKALAAATQPVQVDPLPLTGTDAPPPRSEL